jgi:hypothetical protein
MIKYVDASTFDESKAGYSPMNVRILNKIISSQ